MTRITWPLQFFSGDTPVTGLRRRDWVGDCIMAKPLQKKMTGKAGLGQGEVCMSAPARSSERHARENLIFLVTPQARRWPGFIRSARPSIRNVE
jgi:hypothetical protein